MSDSESKVRHGFLWLGTAGAALRAFDLVSSFVVLWFLTTKEMGIASLSWTVAIIVESFNGLGVGVALVQAPHVEDEERDSLFWFALSFGAFFTGAIVLASPLIATAFGSSALTPFIRVSALRLLLMSAVLIPLQLLHRRLEFRRIAAVQTLAAGGAALVKVGLAASGFGAWALVIAHTSEALFTLIAVYALSPVWPQLRFRWSQIAHFVRFGIKAVGSSVLYQFYRNLDFVIVGRVFGVSALGAYRVAFDVAMVPAMALLDVVNRTAFPVYSRIGIGDPLRLKRVYLAMARTLALLTAPLMVLLFFFGGDILAIVAGPKWQAAAPLIGPLCCAGFLRTQTQAIPQLFHAAGRPELAFYDSLLTLPVLAASGWGLALTFGLQWGANTVSLAWIVTYLITLAVLRFMAKGVIALTVWEYVRNLLHPLALVLLLSGVLAVAAPSLRAALPKLPAAVGGIALVLALVAAYARFVLKVRPADLIPRGSRRSAVEGE